MAKRFPLAGVLDQIATELLEAQTKAKERGAAVMEFAECEVEFGVEVETEGEAGIKIWVIKIGGGAKKNDTHKIKLKFTSLADRKVVAKGTGKGPANRPELHRAKEESRPF